jgi:hypothetical protein
MSTKASSTKSTEQPVVRPVPMGLFPTLNSLQSVIDLALSQLPLQTPNSIVSLLMIYHNTLLKELQDEQKAT